MTQAIAVVGAGLVGARHARIVANHPDARLSVIVDPAPAAAALAAELGAAHAPDLDAVASGSAEAAIIATPNARHRIDALRAAELGWPVLVEKPIAAQAAEARDMIAAFAARDLPLLVGHHRRYHAAVGKARQLLADGAIGQISVVSILWAVRKPDAYFDAAWRTGAGAGPIFINLIHEIDLIRYLLGEIAEVRAMAGHTLRGSSAEDSAAIALRMTSGALVTIALTDAGLSPWSFEGASAENPGIAATGAHSWRIVGTEGSLEFPNLRIWSDAEGGTGDWSRPLAVAEIAAETTTPLVAQLEHFLAVVRGEAEPSVTGADALATLEATEAIRQATEG